MYSVQGWYEQCTRLLSTVHRVFKYNVQSWYVQCTGLICTEYKNTVYRVIMHMYKVVMHSVQG